MKVGLLEKLINTYGASGDEKEVRDTIKKEIKKYVDEIHIDKFGNLIAHKKGVNPKVMLAAHMDEIALMIKRITKKGKIVFSTVGSVEVPALIGQKVIIKTKKGPIFGVITSDKLSAGDEINELPKVTDLFVDTGLEKNQLTKMGINIGDYVYFYGCGCEIFNKEFLCGKALDNRIGCFVLIELARLLKNSKNEIFYVFTVQEEIGLYGARASVYKIDPDWAIVIDATSTDDVYDTPTRSIGKGPCITMKDAEMIGNRQINEWLIKVAKKNKIPFQYEVTEYGATDALVISFSKGGIPATNVCIPVRNIHSSIGTASLKDIENTIKLLVVLLKSAPKFKRVKF
jgi:endoglucanase